MATQHVVSQDDREEYQKDLAARAEEDAARLNDSLYEKSLAEKWEAEDERALRDAMNWLKSLDNDLSKVMPIDDPFLYSELEVNHRWTQIVRAFILAAQCQDEQKTTFYMRAMGKAFPDDRAHFSKLYKEHVGEDFNEWGWIETLA